MGAQLNRVRERGSGGQILKPHTPSRVTKVTKGMCKRLRPILLSTPAILSLQTGGKHTLAQNAFCNLLVSENNTLYNTIMVKTIRPNIIKLIKI